MLSTHESGARSLKHLKFATRIATRLLSVCAFAAIAFCLFSVSAQAQSLSLGTLTTNGSPSSCNDGAGFYYYVYPNTGLALDMTCQAATVSGCSQVINGQTITPDPWTVTIGYLNPVGVISGLTAAKGLIVLHGGDGGTMPESFALTDSYFRGRVRGCASGVGQRLGICLRQYDREDRKHPGGRMPTSDGL
jgi:hypothetical protein